MNRGIVLVLTIGLACSSPETEPASSATVSETSPAPAVVSLQGFQQVRWIDGRWLGSGGAYPAFYEEYRFVDDSTIRMRAFPDSTFTTASDSSWIELRNGEVRKRGDNRAYVVVAMAVDSIRFAQPGMSHGGHTFTRRTDDEWIATLHSSRQGGQPTVYTMRRLNPGAR